MNKTSLEEVVKVLEDIKVAIPLPRAAQTQKKRNDALDAAITALNCLEKLNSSKGKWINEGRIIRCNKCKTGYAVVKGMKSALTYNFCPNCGADMR